MVWQAIVSFFKAVGTAYATAKPYIDAALAIATVAMGVKNYRTQQDMLAKGQDIMGTKIAAGGGIPIIYGTRRVGSTIVYMDTSANRSKDLYVVYAIALGELDEIMLETIEVDGNRLTDGNQFRNGGYLGTDKITSGNGSLCTGNQTGGSANLSGGTFGTNPALSYRYVFNAHHGKASQTADPMLRASIGATWSTAHKLNGIAYIAGSFEYDSAGMFSGIPQITVVVRGKKVYDQRSDSTAGGSGDQRIADVNTYQYSNNPAICFQDYILNADYGKQIPINKVNFTSFTTAANLCDTELDQPFFNGNAKPITWSGISGNKFITITDENKWWQNKVGELIDLYDSDGNKILDAVEILAAIRDGFFDENDEFLLYIDATLGSNFSSNTGTYLNKVKRFTLNGVLDTNDTVMDNSKEMLAAMRGIFTYFNGLYELRVEDAGSATFNINDSHIIDEAGISIDYGMKSKKANKVIVEYFNAHKRYELDTQTVLHHVSGQDYTFDDDGEVLEIRAEFPFCSDPYAAFNYGKAILTRSRNQTSVQFTGTPELYKTNVGDIVNLTYLGLGFNGKLFRIEALELMPDGLLGVSMLEYFDIYTWEVPAEEPVETHANTPSAYAVKKPENITFTDTNASATDRPFLAWTLPTDYPYYQWRVNVVDSSGNQQINRIVDVNNCDLNYLPKGTGYVASITALNTLGVESTPETKSFTIGDEPTGTGDLQDGAVTDLKVNDLSAVKINTGELNLGTESGMAVKQAKTGYTDTTTGFWLGNDGGTPKFNIGTSTNHFKFDGTGVSIKGALEATALTIDGNATITGTLDASVITLNGNTLSSLFGVTGTGSGRIMSIGYIAQNQLKVTNEKLQYLAATTTGGSVVGFEAFSVTGSDFKFYSSAAGNSQKETIIQKEGSIKLSNLSSSPSGHTSNAIYNIGGALYFNGNAIGTGSSNITSIVAGTNLNGGGNTGAVTLNLDSTITGNHTFSNNVIISGDLTVNGTTTTVNTNDLNVKDKNITLNYSTGDSSASANGAGITIQDAVSVNNDATLTWNTANDSFNFTHAVNVTGNIGVTGTVDGRDIATDGTKLDGIAAGATTDQTQAEINALGITAIGLSGTPNITVGTISSGAITSSSTGTFTSNVTANGVTIGASDVRSSSNILTIGGTSEVVRIHSGNFDLTSGVHKVGGTTVIDASRNLTNIISVNSSNGFLGNASGTTPSSCKLHLGAINSSGSSAIAQFGGFTRTVTPMIVHESVGSSNAVAVAYTGGDVDLYSSNEGAGANKSVRINALKIQTTTVIDASRNLTNIGTIGCGFINSSANISGQVGLFTAPNQTTTLELQNTFTSSAHATIVRLKDDSGSDWWDIQHNHSDNSLGIDYKDSEKFRITSAGTVLVGKPAEGTNTDGIELNRQDVIVATRNGDAPLILNRRTSDGDIAVFRKDNASVGSIGSYFGAMYIGSPTGTDGHIRLGQAELVPATSSGANRDNYMDLGISAAKFKDLYLSGTARSNTVSINGTTVIDASRNLTNIGIISSGAITSSSSIRANDWYRGASNTNTLFSNTSQGTIIQTPSNTNNAAGTFFIRDSLGTVHFSLNTNTNASSFHGGTISSGAITAPKLYINNGTTYGVGVVNGASARFDTVDSGVNTDPLELVYYSGSGVIVGAPGSSKFLSVLGDIRMNNTTVIDASRNLTNISNIQIGNGNYLYLYGTNHSIRVSTGVEYTSSDMHRFLKGSTEHLRIDANGNGIFTGDVQAYSDERLKDNIQTLDGKKALQMRGVSFTRDGRPSSGVIAQEVEKIAPELVMTADDEIGTKSVAYGNLVGYLIETVKDQQAQIDELKAMIKKVA